MGTILLRTTTKDYEGKYHVYPDKLAEGTTWFPHGNYASIDWKSVRNLHILVEDRYSYSQKNDVKDGIYLSKYGSQVLLYGVPKKPEQWYVDQCRENLVLLNVNSKSTETLNLSRAVNLRYLRIGRSGYTPTYRFVQGVESLTKLEELSLNSISLSDDLDLEQMTLLQHIDIRPAGNNHSISIRGIHRQKELKSLRLWFALYPDQLDVSWFPGLEELALHFLEGSTRVCGVSSLKHLKELNLGGSSSRDIPDLSALPHLISLVLQHFPDCTTLPGIGSQKDLDYLCINNLGIRQIPDGIRNLKNLENLELYELELDELPHWLPELNLPFQQKWGNCIKFNETTIQGVDMSIFDQPQEVILKWFKSLKTDGPVPLQEVKVVFLGDGEAGKSHTIARLMNDGGDPDPTVFDGQSTPGIVIRHKNYTLDGRSFRVNYWDFGGQEIMHSMHRIFMTGRTMYVIVLNARDDTQNERARYWLHNVKSFAPDAPVLLVLNKIDQNENAAVNEVDLRGRYEKLTQVVRLSALMFSRAQFNDHFTNVLLEEIQKTGYLDAQWPQSWIQVKKKLENMDSHYILGDDYQTICEEYMVNQNQRELLHWFNDLGISFCYDSRDDYTLEDHVILRPDWITNALYIILFNRLDGASNGRIPHRSIYDILKNAHRNPRIRCTLPEARYTVGDIDYVLRIMRKFKLSFFDGNDTEFVPMLCQQNSTVDVWHYHKDEGILEFNMEFDYLPNNLLHRLMVERHSELDMDNVWRTGARFEFKELGYSAVVSIDGNTLRFLIRHNNPMHRPNTYLTMLKANVDRIVKTMGIKAPSNQLIYKLDGRRDCFDLEMLKAMQEAGQTMVFSMIWRKMLSIDDILNQSAPDDLEDEKKLIKDIANACEHLQTHRFLQNEEEMNLHLKQVLWDRGYTVTDQTLSGRGKMNGEPDLLLMNEQRQPWTIIEALRVGTSMRFWDQHLTKLLLRYNAHGLSPLFLIGYVECDAKTWPNLWRRFSEHMRYFSPDRCEIAAGSYEELQDISDQSPYLRIAKCDYLSGEERTTVYHIFVKVEVAQ